MTSIGSSTTRYVSTLPDVRVLLVRLETLRRGDWAGPPKLLV